MSFLLNIKKYDFKKKIFLIFNCDFLLFYYSLLKKKKKKILKLKLGFTLTKISVGHILMRFNENENLKKRFRLF
jgi:hypothetical protein